MKRHFSLAFLLCLILTLTACASVEKLFIKPVTRSKVVEVAAVTNYVPVIVPGPVQTQVITQVVAGATVTITNTVETTRVITNTVLIAAHIETNDVIVGYEPNSRLTSGIAQAQGINAAFNPTPSSPFVEWGLGLITLISFGLAKWKTSQLNTANTNVDRLKDVAGSLIKAVETYPSQSTQDLKAHVKAQAVQDGTQADLSPLVKQATGEATGEATA